jgi:hypothetical protein
MCPLLPGQRLNILEVPTESISRSSSQIPDVFTRNPADKYQKPVPPKPLPSSRLDDLCMESYKVPMQSLQGGPRSATHPPSGSMSRGFERHARSASSTSPQHSRGAVFAEFKGLKDRLVATKRSANPLQQELQIGVPTLVSTTAEVLDLVPLSRTSKSLRRAPQTSSSLPPPVTAKVMREFSPLGSHPIEPMQDFDFGFSQRASSDEKRSSRRYHSRASSATTSSGRLSSGRARASSLDVRRTRHFLSPNEPWVSTPRPHQTFNAEAGPAPMLQRPSGSLEPPSMDDRPSSRHGADMDLSLRGSLLDVEKDLPPLPRYLVPAPLFAYNGTTPTPGLVDREEGLVQVPEQGHDEQCSEEVVEPLREPVIEAEDLCKIEDEKYRSHFSTWSTESSTFSVPTTDEDATHSPTFSSFTSDSSDMGGSPQRISGPFTHGDQVYDSNDNGLSESFFGASPPSSPPKLSLKSLHISSFGPSLLNLNVDGNRPRSAVHRQVACFGLGFQGYSLPEDETESQTTITKIASREEPAVVNGRESSVSHLEKLMSEFGYLGDALL